VPSAVSLGVTAGILELVPAIGPLTALLVASSQAGDHVVGVIVFLGALRLVQDYAIYPRLIRRGMHLSTPAVILTIWCGATLARAPGVILAIPVAGFVSVSLRHWREYREIERLVRTPRSQVAKMTETTDFTNEATERTEVNEAGLSAALRADGGSVGTNTSGA
jgi:predicted PurR-regulated permease PerM